MVIIKNLLYDECVIYNVNRYLLTTRYCAIIVLLGGGNILERSYEELSLSTVAQKPNLKPLLKWAGGKTQLLSEILPKVPKHYGRYIEPFIGGGAVFFALNPAQSIIADSNPELINMYKQVANNVDDVIRFLSLYQNNEEIFYYVRAQRWEDLPPAQAAARMIYLNRTCFNGLYRVNRKGQFNSPFGRYKNPKFCDPEALHEASIALKNATIICGDYISVLREYALPGDFVFLDPPYLPVSKYSDFKRYTKEQFYEEDHIQLAQEVQRLHELGCYVILTNSNHPLVHDLYRAYTIDVVQTKRYISCNGNSRLGEDVIVNIPPKMRILLNLVPEQLPDQVKLYPSTRYMGSKSKLLKQIWSVASQFRCDSVIDLFAGSAIVGYMFKAQGKSVISNDYMAMSTTYAQAMIENSTIILPKDEAERLLLPSDSSDHFVATTFPDLYYTASENDLIDTIRSNITSMRDPYKRAIAMSALMRACIKKRPRGIFTYVGERYNDGRKDLQKSLEQQFLEAVSSINNAVFDNGKQSYARNCDAMELKGKPADLVYIDPPYYSPYSDNEYVRRYHFVEGLARNWEGVEIQQHTQTKKFRSYPTPFSTRKGASSAFDLLFRKYRDSVIIVSYSSNSQPTLDEMVALLAKHKTHVEVVPINYRYSFGNQGEKVEENHNVAREYLFVGF